MSQGKAKPTVVKAKESPLFLDQPEPSTFLDKILIKASTQISRSGLFTYNFDLSSLYVDWRYLGGLQSTWRIETRPQEVRNSKDPVQTSS